MVARSYVGSVSKRADDREYVGTDAEDGAKSSDDA